MSALHRTLRPLLHFLRRLPPTLLLCCASLLPAAALAEDDPPARVARLSLAEGEVSFAAAGSDDWQGAMLNRPLTSGDRLWVAPGGRAELRVGSTALRLDGGSALEIEYLGDLDLRAKLTEGSLALRVRDYPEDEYIEIDTPNLGFTVRAPGEYRFDVDADGEATTLSVRSGAGAVYDDDTTRPVQRVQSGQRLRYEGTDLYLRESARVVPRDAFDRWVAQRDARDEARQSSRYVSREMTGYEDLDEHGEWQTVEGVGMAWFPRVTVVGWAPYRYGRWVWVAPWGWTWVDDAPWGFAPFHYGRWAWYGQRWCWVPGPIVRRPVYAPALVAFVGGGGGGVSWSISLSSGPAVGWFPLGPGEPFRPGYVHRPRYLERINPHIPHGHIPPSYRFQHQPHAVVTVPAQDFLRERPVRPGPALPERELSRLPVRQAPPPMTPVRVERGGDDAIRMRPPETVFRRPAIGDQGRPPTSQPTPPRHGQFPSPPPAQIFPREQPVTPGFGSLPPRNEPRNESRNEWPRHDAPRGYTPPPRSLPDSGLPHPNPPERYRSPQPPQPGFGGRPDRHEPRPPEARMPEMRIPERAPEMRRPEMRAQEAPRPAAPPAAGPDPQRFPRER